MARVWGSKTDIDTAIDTLKTCQETLGKAPVYLLDQYRKTLAASKRGLVQHFYERLAQEVPEMLEDFAEIQPDTGKNKEAM